MKERRKENMQVDTFGFESSSHELNSTDHSYSKIPTVEIMTTIDDTERRNSIDVQQETDFKETDCGGRFIPMFILHVPKTTTTTATNVSDSKETGHTIPGNLRPSITVQENTTKSQDTDSRRKENCLSPVTMEKNVNFVKAPITCKFCGKPFTSNSSRNRHIKTIHEGHERLDNLNKKHACDFCCKRYVSKRDLLRHIDVVHSPPEYGLMFACDQCSYKTHYEYGLKRHKIKIHSGKCNSKYNRYGSKPVKCSLCNLQFSSLGSLTRHESKQHQIVKISKTLTRKCPICSFVSYDHGRKEINGHFEQNHGISLELEHYNFTNMNQFNEWRLDIEKESTTRYIVRKAKPNNIFYVCHRTGNFISKGLNIRNMRSMGSCKINGFCPSNIRVKINESGSVNVTYLPIHIGHRNDQKSICSTDNKRKSFARKRAIKTPYDEILKEVKNSITSYYNQGINLTNEKDVLSIQSFDLDEDMSREHIAVNTDTWIEDLKSSKETALIAYKRLGESITEFPQLREKDVLLIFISEAQSSLLKSHGPDIICIDRTPSSDDSNFQLFTVLTLFESREGFPVAFMLTNRSDNTVLHIFFQKIKHVSGQITPDLFISDMDSVYTSWTKIMGPAKLQLFSTWHVLKAWRSNLSKIKNKDKREEVYKILKMLLYELDIEIFYPKLLAVLNRLQEDDDTKNYFNYFQDHYIKDDLYTQWAYCYRVHLGINTNMSLENFNKILKCCYLQGQKVQYMDKDLCAILITLQDKLFDWFVGMEKCEISRKMQVLTLRHTKSVRFQTSDITESSGEWQVLSSKDQEFCTVKKVKECKTCQLQCLSCNTCFHEFVCTCMDNIVKNNMCEHIHFVAQNISNEQKCFKVDEEGLTINCDVYKEYEVIEDAITNEIKVENGDINNKQLWRDEFFQKVHNFGKYLNSNISTKEEMDYVEQQMEEMITTLEIMKSAAKNGFMLSSNGEGVDMATNGYEEYNIVDNVITN